MTNPRAHGAHARGAGVHVPAAIPQGLHVPARPRIRRLLALARDHGPLRGPLLRRSAGEHPRVRRGHPGTINPEIGTEEDLARLHEALTVHRMGLVVDVVPNHMCVNTNDNVWWNDVLENGPGSPFAKFFDIDWRPPKTELRDKVLLPVLGDQYGRVLENAELELREADGAFSVTYHDRTFPVGPGTYPLVLEGALRRLRDAASTEKGDIWLLEGIIALARALPARSETDAGRVVARQRAKEIREERAARAPLGPSRGAPRRGRRDSRDERLEGIAPELRCARGAPRRAGVSPQLLARGRGPHQLPAILRSRRPRGDSNRGARGARGGPCPGLRAPGARLGDGSAHRPRRRAEGASTLPRGHPATSRRPVRRRREDPWRTASGSRKVGRRRGRRDTGS